jgi:hypothetical protein
MSESRNTRRAAAVGTLLLSALFAVSLTALVLSSPLYLLLSWLGLLLLVVGAARAVRFRDARRVVGALLGIAGLGVAVVSIVAAGTAWSPYWVAALLLSGVGAGFTARRTTSSSFAGVRRWSSG